MIFQSTPYNCGPAAVVNACSALGVRISEAAAANVAGTTQKDGTDSAGLVKALESVGLIGVPFDTDETWLAKRQIDRAIPSIICVNGWDHWVTVIGHNYDRYIVVDSANTKKNRSVNGVHSMSFAQLEKIWGHGTCKTYSGIIVLDSPTFGANPKRES